MSDDGPQGKSPSEEGVVFTSLSGLLTGVRAFFTSLTGLLTAVAALITATVGLIALFDDNGDGGNPEAWVKQVNTLCLTAAQRFDGIQLDVSPEGVADFSTFYADYSEATDQLVEDFKRLPAPSDLGVEAQPSQLIRLWESGRDSFRQASLADEGESSPAANEAESYLRQAGEIASGFGAVACAELP
jgi:hypothetical protein